MFPELLRDAFPGNMLGLRLCESCYSPTCLSNELCVYCLVLCCTTELHSLLCTFSFGVRKSVYAQSRATVCLQMTASDIAQTVSQLCEVSNTDRLTAMAALRRAIQENVRGKDAITNRAAEILLMS